jgi:hypothetical protein
VVRELTYLDFDVLLERVGKSRRKYRARVVNAPAGQTLPVVFTLPVTRLELENLVLRIGRPRRVVRRVDAPETAAIKAFGGQLYRALFRDDLEVNLLRSLSEAAAQGAGLRIRLRLSDTPELAELPWEFLYDQTRNRFLSLSDRTPLVRFLEVPDPPRPLRVIPPLHVLVMISSPSDYPQLDIEQEWIKLHTALGPLEQASQVQVTRLETATLAALRQRLRRADWHVLHFIGHGGFDPQTHDGVLALEDQMGRSRLVSGQDLGVLLHDHDPLRLVVLNACEGARADPSDTFAGTAQSLIQQGVPAVVAMQFEITDPAAITFASELYAAVADSYPLDAAMAEARKAIWADGNQIEWATPVLHLRAPDGRIFDTTPAAATSLPPSTAASSALSIRPKEEEQVSRDDGPPALRTNSGDRRKKAPSAQLDADDAYSMGRRSEPGDPFYAVFQKRQQLIRLLERESKIAKLLGAQSMVEAIDTVHRRITTDPFRLLVLGEFKRGKSTLINALLGQEVLPARPQPTTGLVTEVKWGSTPHAILHYPSDLGEPPIEIPYRRLQDYVTLRQDDTYSFISPYEVVELFWPSALLAGGLELIDSPGLNETYASEQALRNYLATADIVIFLFGAGTVGSMSELHTVDQIIRPAGFDDVFFVCNMFDLVRENDRDQVKDYVERKLASRTRGGRKRIFFVSARDALKGRTEENQKLIDRSGITLLERRLEEALIERLPRKSSRWTVQIGESIRGLRSLVRDRREALSVAGASDVEKTRNELDTLDREIDNIDSEVQSYLVQFE